DWFARNVLGRSDGRSLPPGRLIFTAYSGGGAALNTLLNQHTHRRACNPDEVHAFDAFYGPVDGVKSWVAARLALDRAMIARTKGVLERHLIDSLGGLRVIHGDGTWAGSCEVDGVLPFWSDPLARLYRVDWTPVAHNDIPPTFGGRLLRDRAAFLLG